MKRFINIKSVLAVLFLGGLVGAACSTSDDGFAPDANVVSLAKTDFHIYSGGKVISSSLNAATRSAYMNANMYDQDWDCVPNVDLTADELAELIELFSKGQYTENDVILPFENYWVQQVFKGTDTYTPTDKNGNPVNGTTITGSNQMDKLVAYNENHTEYEYGGYLDENYQWHQTVTENHYEHVNNFNYGNNTNYPGQCGCGIVHEGTTLMVDMSTEGITPNNQFGFHESYGTSHNYNNYIIIQYKGEWYVGFDYEMHKDEAQNAGEVKNVERDWNFTDWIVKITPAYHKGDTPESPETPEVPEIKIPDDLDPDFPQDPDGPEVKDPDDIDPNFPQDPETPEVKEPTDEVEVNLAHSSMVNEHLRTKLSIHVRAATDVEVFIPVPKEYLIENDDLVIFHAHKDVARIEYGGPESIEFNINGNTVTLNCEITDEGIRVWTDGINEEVIAYCYENYHDGLNFEIFNYFNCSQNEHPEIIDYLNQATVKFLDKEPDLYVNAFNRTDNGEKSPFDCTVNIVKEQKGYYEEEPRVGTHLNNSPWNKLYDKK